MTWLCKYPKLFAEIKFWYWILMLRSGLKNERELSVLPQIVQPGETAIDAGAHCGRYTIPLSAIVGPMGQVLSFEPVEASFKILKRLKSFYRSDNVVLYRQALGEFAGTGTIITPFTSDRLYNYSCSAVNSNGKKDLIDGFAQEVEFVTLDSVSSGEVRQRVGYIKCDVEGYELFVLRGGENLLRKHKPVVQCEIIAAQTFPYGYDPEDLVAFMSALGYGLYAFNGNSIQPCDISPSLCNYFFIPKQDDLDRAVFIGRSM